jgi:hypothetical protein
MGKSTLSSLLAEYPPGVVAAIATYQHDLPLSLYGALVHGADELTACGMSQLGKAATARVHQRYKQGMAICDMALRAAGTGGPKQADKLPGTVEKVGNKRPHDEHPSAAGKAIVTALLERDGSDEHRSEYERRFMPSTCWAVHSRHCIAHRHGADVGSGEEGASEERVYDVVMWGDDGNLQAGGDDHLFLAVLWYDQVPFASIVEGQVARSKQRECATREHWRACARCQYKDNGCGKLCRLRKLSAFNAATEYRRGRAAIWGACDRMVKALGSASFC